ncbi:hypothetical protein [Streptomonospora litoralis]|nr:hypothetical protein [Streptomonospora litoralis]
MPSLTRLRVPDGDWTFAASGTLDPVLAELTARGAALDFAD